MYQQRGLASQGIGRAQISQLRAQLVQQPGGGTLLAHAKSHAISSVWALGERAQIEPDDGPFHPAARRRDNFFRFDAKSSATAGSLIQPTSSILIARFIHPRADDATIHSRHTDPGDGIGPEIVDATLAALEALGAPFEWDTQIAGLEGVKSAGDPLPAKTLDSIRRTRLALKGPLETPSGGGYRSSNVRLREEFKLYANLRPARTMIPGGRFENIDLVVVRENLEGLYIGHEAFIQIDDDPHAVAMATGINTRQGSRRILEFAFEHAIATGRKKVAIVHKANIMKALTGIFLETAWSCTNASTRADSRSRR